jgi:hypothetical protein
MASAIRNKPCHAVVPGRAEVVATRDAQRLNSRAPQGSNEIDVLVCASQKKCIIGGQNNADGGVLSSNHVLVLHQLECCYDGRRKIAVIHGTDRTTSEIDSGICLEPRGRRLSNYLLEKINEWQFNPGNRPAAATLVQNLWNRK